MALRPLLCLALAVTRANRTVTWPLRGTGRAFVHIVSTRFCLQQGHQESLVEARLVLLLGPGGGFLDGRQVLARHLGLALQGVALGLALL